MAFADELARLTARAKEAETRVAAAQAKGRTELELDVSAARASARAQALDLQGTSDAGEVGHYRVRSQPSPETAEEDAWFAIDHAYGAIEEAEYAALEATLERLEVSEPAARLGASD